MDVYKSSSFNYKKALLILVVILVLGLISGTSYYLLSKTHKSATTKVASITPVISTNQVAIGNPSQQYYSDNLSLGFNYPRNWVVSDVSGSNQISVTSPLIKLFNSSNQLTTGKIILTIISVSPTSLTGFANGSPTASLASQLINYTNPTPTQKGSTYISFLNYGSSNSANSINAIYITGNSGYKVNQAVPESDIAAVNPTVFYSFISCSSSSCATATQSIAIPVSLWKNPAFSNPLLSMLESLSIN